MIDEGTYIAQPRDWKFCESKGGTEQFAVSLEIVEGPKKGTRMTWAGSFASAASEELVYKAMRSMGFSGQMTDAGEVTLDKEKSVSIVVEHEDYEGKTRARVRYINDLGGGLGGFKAISPVKNSRLRERFAVLGSRFESEYGAPPISSAPPKRKDPAPASAGSEDFPNDNFDTPVADDDDIPF